jgi:hypothetical protein
MSNRIILQQIMQIQCVWLWTCIESLPGGLHSMGAHPSAARDVMKRWSKAKQSQGTVRHTATSYCRIKEKPPRRGPPSTTGFQVHLYIQTQHYTTENYIWTNGKQTNTKLQTWKQRNQLIISTSNHLVQMSGRIKHFPSLFCEENFHIVDSQLV